VGALERLSADGTIASDDRVVIFNTAAATKYALYSAPPVAIIPADAVRAKIIAAL
jgi:hypothetical protein